MLQEPLDGQVVGYRAQESHAGSWGKVHLEVSLQQGGSQEPKVKSTPSTWDKSIRLLPGLQPSLGCETLGTVDNPRYGIASSGFTRWPPWNGGVTIPLSPGAWSLVHLHTPSPCPCRRPAMRMAWLNSNPRKNHNHTLHLPKGRFIVKP